MTVAEFIKALEHYPPTTPVLIQSYEDGYEVACTSTDHVIAVEPTEYTGPYAAHPNGLYAVIIRRSQT